jgi:hypothetical protein
MTCSRRGGPGIRYAAALDTGEGFLAFEGSDIDAHGLAALGRVFTVVDSDPQPEWWWFLIPKRRIANGLERFSLIRPKLSSYATASGLAAAQFVQGLAMVLEDDEPFVLVETDGEPVFDAEWSALAGAYRDIRKELAPA